MKSAYVGGLQVICLYLLVLGELELSTMFNDALVGCYIKQ